MLSDIYVMQRHPRLWAALIVCHLSVYTIGLAALVWVMFTLGSGSGLCGIN